VSAASWRNVCAYGASPGLLSLVRGLRPRRNLEHRSLTVRRGPEYLRRTAAPCTRPHPGRRCLRLATMAAKPKVRRARGLR